MIVLLHALMPMTHATRAGRKMNFVFTAALYTPARLGWQSGIHAGDGFDANFGVARVKTTMTGSQPAKSRTQAKAENRMNSAFIEISDVDLAHTSLLKETVELFIKRLFIEHFLCPMFFDEADEVFRSIR